MLEFENPKWQDEVTKRVTAQKKLKAGRKLHQPSLETLGIEERFAEYITGIGFDWILEVDETPVPEVLAKEFFTSFRFKYTTDLEAKNISFRAFDRDQRMSLNDFSIRMGLYTAAQVATGEWFGRDIGLPQKKSDFNQQAVWEALTSGHAPDFKASESRGIYITDPALRLAQVYLGCNLLGQANTTAIITLAELYFMWCMREQRKVHLGFWLAYSIHQIATRPPRHLNVCHLLGAYLRRNWIMECAGRFDCCPKPELFNVDFFVRIQVVERTRGRRLRFYKPSRQEQQEDQTGGEKRLPDRPSSPGRQTGPQLDLVPTEGTEREGAAQSDNAWKLRVEQMMTQLVENSHANLVVLNRLLEAVRSQAPARHPPPPSPGFPQGRRPSHPARPPSTQTGQSSQEK